MKHSELEEQLKEHFDLKEKVVGIAVGKYREDGLDEKLGETLGRDPTDEEVRKDAQDVMAVYMCATCRPSQPYCGGRADCVQMQDLVAESLKCHECEWAALAGENDRRCMVHGHKFAMFKCDSCCAIATWNCTYHHFCERCHGMAFGAKSFPCPGPDKCPLGIPHPKNIEADFSIAMNAKKVHKSFVLGCTACLGYCEEQEEQEGREGEWLKFGYPARDFQSFASGEALLSECGEQEIRERLRAKHPPLLSEGAALECAERLLLHETGMLLPEVLLEQLGKDSKTLKKRLEALCLKTTGSPLDLARRLLCVMRAEGPEAVHQAEEGAKMMALRQSPAVKAKLERQKQAMLYYIEQQKKRGEKRAQEPKGKR
jgi:hypothetical protein